MADFAALPLFTDAITADCAHLSDAEFGLYLRVLMLMWRTPGCRVPNDPAWIVRKIHRDFDSLIKPILDEFCSCDGNYWTQKRLLKEWHYLHEKRQKSVVAANARYNKDSRPHSSTASRGDGHASAQPPKNATHSKTEEPGAVLAHAPNPTPPHSIRKEERKITPIPPALNDDSFDVFWKEYPRNSGSKKTAREIFTKLTTTNGVPHDLIIDGARAFARYCQQRHTPVDKTAHAATWLNQHRWEVRYGDLGDPQPNGLALRPERPITSAQAAHNAKIRLGLIPDDRAPSGDAGVIIEQPRKD